MITKHLDAIFREFFAAVAYEIIMLYNFSLLPEPNTNPASELSDETLNAALSEPHILSRQIALCWLSIPFLGNSMFIRSIMIL